MKWRRIRRVYFKKLDDLFMWLLLASFAVWLFGKLFDFENVMVATAYFSFVILAFVAGIFSQKVVLTEYDLSRVKDHVQEIERRLEKIESKLP